MSETDNKSRLPQGLTAAQVRDSRDTHGDNMLTAPPRQSLWSQLLDKFADPLIRILLVVLLLAMGIAVYECWWLERGPAAFVEPIGVLVAIVLATLVGFAVEVNANKKFDLLNKTHDDTPVRVRRDGGMMQVPRRDIVMGDIVLLEAGEKVPADGDLLQGINLMVNESSLTGEPTARKWHEPEQVAAHEGRTTYPVNRLLRGSNVIEGNAVMRVTAVGNATEYGHVYRQSQIETGVKTPLMLQLDRLGRFIARFSYAVAALIVVGRMVVFWLDGVPDTPLETARYFIDTVMLAVTLIVVSVPEGLPMSVTLSLALSMRRMLQTNNLVRKMHACETMGAATVICTDKTGTLTQNRMTVLASHFVDDADRGPDDRVAMSMAVNSTAHLDTSGDRPRVLGNPTEGALLLWLRDRGVDYEAWRDRCVVEAMLPFDTERKYMAVTVRDTVTGRRWLLVKGAPEVVAAMSRPQPDDVALRSRNRLHDYQRKAMRALAFAVAPLDDGRQPLDPVAKRLDPEGLDLLGFVAISDPVRDDVPRAIADCHRAGIEVKMVTGDAPETACEIARQVGILPDGEPQDGRVIEGAAFERLPDGEAARRALSLRVMARARPADKARLVALLQRQGQVVAVTGDGTNDAPALNAAQVGLSMGSGTSVAKEAGDITILDDSFASINKAVLWGRSLYRNIQRFIVFQLVVNVCACLVVGVCSFFNRQSPLTVTQMLWVNLIMDTFAALALASLPPNSNVMRRPPRRVGSHIITPAMAWFIVGVGLLFAAVMGGLFYWMHHNAAAGNFRGSEITPNEVAVFFTTFVFLQFWNMFNARAFMSGHSAFHNLRGSRLFFAILLVIAVGQVAIVEWASPVFNCAPMSLRQWLVVVGSTSVVMVAGELWRLKSAHGPHDAQ